MKYFCLFFTILFGCLILDPNLAHAKTQVTLGPVTGTGVDEHKIETVRNLVYSEIVAHPKAEYVDEDFDLEIVVELTRLQRSYILTLYGYNQDGESTSEKAKLSDFDEIDVAAKRLVAAIIENKSVSKTAARGEVLEQEQREPTRVKSIQGWEIALGGAYPLTDALDNQDAMFALAVSYFFDVERFFVELRGDFQMAYNDSSRSLTSFTVGGNYFYYNGRTVGAYVGVGLGFGGATDEDLDESVGFVGSVDVGFMLLRHADINIDVRLRNSILATKFNGETPMTSALMVGVVF